MRLRYGPQLTVPELVEKYSIGYKLYQLQSPQTADSIQTPLEPHKVGPKMRGIAGSGETCRGKRSDTTYQQGETPRTPEIHMHDLPLGQVVSVTSTSDLAGTRERAEARAAVQRMLQEREEQRQHGTSYARGSGSADAHARPSSSSAGSASAVPADGGAGTGTADETDTGNSDSNDADIVHFHPDTRSRVAAPWHSSGREPLHFGVLCWNGGSIRSNVAHVLFNSYSVLIWQEFDEGWDDALQQHGFEYAVAKHGEIPECTVAVRRLLGTVEMLQYLNMGTNDKVISNLAVTRVVFDPPRANALSVVVASLHLHHTRAKSPQHSREDLERVKEMCNRLNVDILGGDFNQSCALRSAYGKPCVAVQDAFGPESLVGQPPDDCTGFIIPETSALTDIIKYSVSIGHYRFHPSDFNLAESDQSSHWPLKMHVWRNPRGSRNRGRAARKRRKCKKNAARADRRREKTDTS